MTTCIRWGSRIALVLALTCTAVQAQELAGTFDQLRVLVKSGDTLTITDNAAGSPRSVSLSGNGTVPEATLDAAGLDFGNQTVGTTGGSRSVTLSNTGSGPLTISSIVSSGAHTGEFAQTGTCGNSLAAGAAPPRPKRERMSSTMTSRFGARKGTAMACITMSSGRTSRPLR